MTVTKTKTKTKTNPAPKVKVKLVAVIDHLGKPAKAGETIEVSKEAARWLQDRGKAVAV